MNIKTARYTLWLKKILWLSLFVGLAVHFKTRHQIGLFEQAKFLFAIYLLVFCAGYFILEKTKVLQESFWEKTLFSLVVGYFASTFLLFLLSWIKIPAVFYLLCILACFFHIRTMFTRYKHMRFQEISGKIDNFINESDIVVFALFFLTVITYYASPVWYLNETGFHFIAYKEKLGHMSVLGEILRNFPPKYFPEVIGLPFPSYQLLFHFLTVMTYKITGIPLQTIFFTLIPCFVYLLLLIGVSLFIKKVTRSSIAAYLGIITIFLAYIPGIIPYTWESFYYVNMPSFYGGMVYILALLSLCYYQETDKQFFLVLALFITAVIFQHKGSFALLLMPAIGISLMFLLILRKSWKIFDLKLIAYFFIILFMLIWFTFLTLKPQPTGISIKYGHYVNHIILQSLNRNIKLYKFLMGLPEHARIIFAAAISVVKRGGAGGLIGIFLFTFHALRIFKEGRKARLLDIFFVVQYIVFFLSFLLVADTVHLTNNVNWPSLIILFFLNFIYLARILGDGSFSKKIQIDGTPFQKKAHNIVLGVLTLLIFLRGYPVLNKMVKNLYVVNDKSVYFSKDSYNALEFLKDNTDQNSIVFNNVEDMINKNSVAGIALRRPVLDGNTFGVYYKRERESVAQEVSTIRNTTDSEKLKSFFAKYGVNYYLEDKLKPAKIEERGFLEKVYENKKVIIWKVLY